MKARRLRRQSRSAPGLSPLLRGRQIASHAKRWCRGVMDSLRFSSPARRAPTGPVPPLNLVRRLQRTKWIRPLQVRGNCAYLQPVKLHCGKFRLQLDVDGLILAAVTMIRAGRERNGLVRAPSCRGQPGCFRLFAGRSDSRLYFFAGRPALCALKKLANIPRLSGFPAGEDTGQHDHCVSGQMRNVGVCARRRQLRERFRHPDAVLCDQTTGAYWWGKR